MLRPACTLLLYLTLTIPAWSAQDSLVVTAEAPYEFVSGTISELPPGKIVVSRAILGKPTENRTFSITPDTKIEGKLRMRARVTVGFKPSDEGEPVAMRIIVRPQAPAPKKP